MCCEKKENCCKNNDLMKMFVLISKVLLAVGGLNWGLVGMGMLFGNMNLNLVNLALGGMPTLEAIVYLLVGISAICMMSCKCKSSKDVKQDCCKMDSSSTENMKESM